MTKQDQVDLVEAFRKMHLGPRVLVLPNAWDALSARIFEAVGFDAALPRPAGVAWALGIPDGEKAPWEEVVEATRRRIVRAVRVRVTADIEAGLPRPLHAVRHIWLPVQIASFPSGWSILGPSANS